MPTALRKRRGTVVQSKIRPISKALICEEIVDQIMALIANGDLTPGQRLPPERELSKTFGASRSSLREALRCLSIVGVLTARVGDGTSVALDGGKFLGKVLEWRVITERHGIEDLMEARIALESVTAAKAARRVNRDYLDKFDDILAKMKKALNDPRSFTELDIEFHVTMAAVSGNFLIHDLVLMIRGQLQKVLARVLRLPNARPSTLKEHIAIVDALRRGDSDAAAQTMSRHLEAALKRYHKTVDQ